MWSIYTGFVQDAVSQSRITVGLSATYQDRPMYLIRAVTVHSNRPKEVWFGPSAYTARILWSGGNFFFIEGPRRPPLEHLRGSLGSMSCRLCRAPPPTAAQACPDSAAARSSLLLPRATLVDDVRASIGTKPDAHIKFASALWLPR